MIATLQHSGKGNTVNRAQGPVVARGRGERRSNRQGSGGFSGRENTLYDILMVDTCHYTFVQIYRTYIKSNVSYGLWAMIHQVNQCPLWWGMWSGDRLCMGGHSGAHRRDLRPPLSFAVNLQLL